MLERIKIRWDAGRINSILMKLRDSDAVLEKEDIINLELNLKDLQETLENTELKKNLIKNGRNYVEDNFSWNVISNRFIQLYNTVAKTHRR